MVDILKRAHALSEKATEDRPEGLRKVSICDHARLQVRTQFKRRLALVDAHALALVAQLLNGELPWPLYLCGDPGRGKTCLALAILDHVIGDRRDIEYLGVSSLMNRIANKSPDPWGYWHNAKLAVLDEIASPGRVNDFAVSVIYDAYEYRQNLPTIYISNLKPTEINEHLDWRIESRITSGTCFELKGNDRRFRE